MTQIIGFTRKETMELAGCSSGRLAHLEQSWAIIPYRYEELGKKTVVSFSWEQLLEIRAIEYLRQENILVCTVREIIKFLAKNGYGESLKGKQLVAVNDLVFWLESDWSNFGANIPDLLKANEENKAVRQYILVVIPPLTNIVDDILEVAKHSTTIDFESFQQRTKI